MMKQKNYSISKLILLSMIGIFLGIGTTYAQISAYVFGSNTSSYSAISGGTVVATATATSGAGSLDDVVYSIADGTIPFNFNFNGTNFTGCKISTNGFITFGTTAPSPSGSTTGYTPLSATTAYSGAISPMGRNLNAYFFSGNAAQTGEIRYQVLGSAPNRSFVVQFKNFKTFNTSGTTFGPVLNFQIRLYETTNAIEMIYNCSGNFSSSTAQVGLRGATNGFPSSVANRNVSVAGGNTWVTSSAGTSNASTCEFSGSLMPPTGLIYSYSIVSCPAPQNLIATNITQTAAQLTWTTTGGNGTFKVEYGPAGFVVGTGTVVNNAVSPLNISGLTSGSNYSFYVQQLCGGAGTSANSGPSNFSAGTVGEDCATATTIAVATSLATSTFTTYSSGISSNGPVALCSDVNGNNANDDRWIKFVAPAGGNKLVITTQAGTVNDWVMEVWNSCPGTGSAIKCADDGNAFMPEITLCQTEYVAGQTYYIRFWTYSTVLTGNLGVKVYQASPCPIPPVNDECVNNIRLTVNPPLSCPGAAQTFTTLNATASGDAATCDATTKRDVWFVFNTGNFGDIRLNITPGTATTLKAQLLFECGGFEVACYSPANGNYTFSGLNPQADYILRVWTDSIGAGTFSVCLSDICSNPTAVISGSQTVCTSTSAALSINFTGIAPYTFLYSNGTTNTSVTTSSNPYTLNVTPTATTTYTIVSMSDAACTGSGSGSALVTVVTPATTTLGIFNPVCIDAGLQILSGGLPVGGTYSGVGVSNGRFDPLFGSQTITYTVTYAAGCTRSASRVFSVNPLPTVVYSSVGTQDTACLTASPYTLTGGTPAGGTYSGVSVANNIFTPSSAGLGTHIITYTYTSAAGCTNDDTSTVTVVNCSLCPNPAIANAGPDVTVCNGAATALGGSIGGSASSATWSGGTGTFSPNATTLNATYTPSSADIAAGQVVLTLLTNDPAGICTAASDTKVLSYSPVLSTVKINGNGGFCRPSTGNVWFVNPVPGATYSWVFPTGATITSGQGTNSVTVSFTGTAAAGNIVLTLINSCGTTQRTLALLIRSAVPGTVGAITGVTSVCRNETKLYTVRKLASADSYIWTPPIGTTINGSSAAFATVDTFVNVAFGPTFSGDTLRVIGVNCKGQSVTQRKARINQKTTLPGTPGSLTGQNYGVCAQTTKAFGRTVSGALTYTWRTNIAGALINGQPSPITVPDTTVNITYPGAPFVNGQIYVKSNNGCGSSAEKARTMTAKPNVPDSIYGSSTGCFTLTGTYQITPLYGATSYLWVVPTPLTLSAGQGTEVVDIKYNSTATVKTITARGVNACGNGNTKSLVITVSSCHKFSDGEDLSTFKLEAYPNPASDRLRIEFVSPQEGKFNLLMTDLSGRTARLDIVDAIEGVNQFDWDVSDLASGVYIIHLSNNDTRQQIRIVVTQ